MPTKVTDPAADAADLSEDIHTLAQLLTKHKDRIVVTSNILADPTMQIREVIHCEKDAGILVITKPRDDP